MCIFIYYCIQKRACELKVCPGWFGLRERKVSLWESICCSSPTMFNEHCLISFPPVWLSSVPRRPSGRLCARKRFKQQRATRKKVCGSSLKRVLVFLKKPRYKDLLQLRRFNHTWGTCCRETIGMFDFLVLRSHCDLFPRGGTLGWWKASPAKKTLARLNFSVIVSCQPPIRYDQKLRRFL